MNWRKALLGKKRLGQLSLLNICLLVFSYPITAAIPVLLKVNSTPINIGLRIVYLSLSLFLIFGATLHGKFKGLSLGGWLLLLFWTIYSIRVNYDIHVRGIIFGSYTLFKFYTLFYGSGLLAATATLLTTRYIDLKKLSYYLHRTIIASNISIVLVVLYIYKTINPIAIAARVHFSVELADGSVINNVLNPIVIGFFGELLAILSIYYLLFEKKLKNNRFLLYLGLLLGLYVLLVGGSKGPFVSFFLLSLYLIFLKLYRSRKTSIFILKILSIPTVLIILFIQFVVPKIPWEDLTIFNRMKSWLTNDYSNSLDNRDEKYVYAWEQFLENPIIGSRYLDQFNSYPHNIFLETLMALGMIGGVLFILIMSIILIRVFLDGIGHGGYIFFSIIVLAQILSGITSGSLFASYPLWIIISFYLSINRSRNNRLLAQVMS